MHYQFKVALGHSEAIILVQQDMIVSELLDALSYALQLTNHQQIVGFRDPKTGMIIPPSIICADPDQIIKNEVYECLIKQNYSELGETQASFNRQQENSVVNNIKNAQRSSQNVSRNQDYDLDTPNQNSGLRPSTATAPEVLESRPS